MTKFYAVFDFLIVMYPRYQAKLAFIYFSNCLRQLIKGF